MKDANAAIWITDLSSNGVWVNEKRIPKNEATKIYNRDIISFTPGAPGKGIAKTFYNILCKCLIRFFTQSIILFPFFFE
jgi:hypothetical protein